MADTPTESQASAALRGVAATDPGRPYLVDEGLTYRDFDALADRLAAGLLRRARVGDARVVVWSASVRDRAVAHMGVTRAGMVPVMVPPSVPEDRVRTIVDDTAPAVVLADGEERFGPPTLSPADLAAEDADGPDPDGFPPPNRASSILYTSGSTGTPKGIVQPRDTLDGLIRDFSFYRELGPGAPVVAFAGNVWADLMHGFAPAFGQTLHTYDVARDGTAGLPAFLRERRIAGLLCVPTLLRLLTAALADGERLPDIRHVIQLGEALTWEDVGRLRPHLSDRCEVWNFFGLQEAGGVAVNRIGADTPLSSGAVAPGRILAGVDVEICDEHGRPVPPGEAGEIVVTSGRVMLEYWNRPEQTAGAGLTTEPDGRRRMRTADSGRILPDATLQHLGRIDGVVKVAGHRVDVGEVEIVLGRLPGVAAAAVVAYTDRNGDTRLRAFVTGVPELSGAELRTALGRRLPPPMIPDRIVPLDEIPMLPNGKVDRVTLRDRAAECAPPAGAPAVAGAARSAGTGTGRVADMCRLWNEILGGPPVGPDDNFFDLGGDSVRAARLIAEIERRWDRRAPVSALVEHPTPAGLVEAVEAVEAAGDGFENLLVVQPHGRRPPLIVVHDGTGDVVYARKLSRLLGPDQPLYALRAITLTGRRFPEPDVEALAAHYVSLVRDVVPSGPYVLYGGSGGGMLSFEMAMQLQAAGERVPLVGAADTWWPHVAEPPLVGLEALTAVRAALLAGRVGGAARAAAGMIGDLRGRPAGGPTLAAEVREHLEAGRRIRRVRRKIADGRPVTAEEIGDYSMLVFLELAAPYRPEGVLDGDLLLIRSGGDQGCPDRGWGPLVGGTITIEDSPFTHEMLCREEGADLAAALLDRHLRRLEVPVPAGGR